MKLDQFPEDIRAYLIPRPGGEMAYRCLGCDRELAINRLHYTCPHCSSVLLLYNKEPDPIDRVGGEAWRRIFDYRRMLNLKALKGIFRYHEFISPLIPLDRIVYLGEGHTPMVEANRRLKEMAGMNFFFKNDGMNPSASFKDRGMACALSFINYLARRENMTEVLAVCASTGDTSAAAALYSSYLGDFLKPVVLLPEGKVTPQQLSQPLSSGATVLEIPGVFDDCMKVVESLAENYNVALLNSKNSWRILGQESFSFEIAQECDYEIGDKAVVVPVGNAGNITAVMSGFLKFYAAGVIEALPKIIGVQSEHANPVFQYYQEPDPEKRHFVPVSVRSSVAQAAMIGNPVSMPRVVQLESAYNDAAGARKVFVVQVSEQEIIDAMIVANRNGNIACTQGGESLAGLLKAGEMGYVDSDDVGILDSTAHFLKFAVFQEMYFNNTFDPDFDIRPREDLKNRPVSVRPRELDVYPAPGKPLHGREMERFVHEMTREIARLLRIEPT